MGSCPIHTVLHLQIKDVQNLRIFSLQYQTIPLGMASATATAAAVSAAISDHSKRFDGML